MPAVPTQIVRPPVLRAVLLALLAFCLGLPAASAEDVDPTPLLGVWYRNDYNSLEIDRDRTIAFAGDRRWEASAAQCQATFRHSFQRRSASEILEDYRGRDFYDLDGQPLDGALESVLPAGDYLTLISLCCCPWEIDGGEELILLDDDSLLSVSWGDGAYAVFRHTRTVPTPSHDDLSRQNRLDAQEALQQLSLYGGAIDGVFGSGTEAAIRFYQASIGAEPTGVLSRSQFLRLLHGE